MRKKRDLIISSIFAVLVSIASMSLMNFLLRGRGGVLDLLSNIPVRFHILAFSLYVVSYAVEAFRMWVLLKHRGYAMSFASSFYNNVVGYFFSYITPFAVGGQPFQIYHMGKHGVDTTYSTGLMALRILENTTGSVVAAFSILLSDLGWVLKRGFVIWAGLLMSFSTLVFILVSMVRPVILVPVVSTISRLLRKRNLVEKYRSWAAKFKDDVRYVFRDNSQLVILDFTGWFFVVVLQIYPMYLFLKLSNPDVNLNFWKVFGVINAVNSFAYFVPTPGSSGGIEATYTLVLSQACGDVHSAMVAVMNWRFEGYYMQMLFGAIVMGMGLAFGESPERGEG